MEYEVTSVEMPHRSSPHELISHLGNDQDGWKLSMKSAVTRVERGTATFYVYDRLRDEKFYLAVEKTRNSAHLRASSGGRWHDHLVALKPCSSCSLID